MLPLLCWFPCERGLLACKTIGWFETLFAFREIVPQDSPTHSVFHFVQFSEYNCQNILTGACVNTYSLTNIYLLGGEYICFWPTCGHRLSIWVAAIRTNFTPSSLLEIEHARFATWKRNPTKRWHWWICLTWGLVVFFSFRWLMPTWRFFFQFHVKETISSPHAHEKKSSAVEYVPSVHIGCNLYCSNELQIQVMFISLQQFIWKQWDASRKTKTNHFGLFQSYSFLWGLAGKHTGKHTA